MDESEPVLGEPDSIAPTVDAARERAGALSDTVAALDTTAELARTTATGQGQDHYNVGQLLGSGGMGEVLLAHDTRVGREVAIKRMRAELARGPATARFLREARIQARLDHPAVVPVHDVGVDPDGRPYFTMKRLAGTTLAALLASRTERLQRLLRALVDVCLAIELAHARRIVHRDLKPANIMLGDYGEVYVLDWGVARVLAEHDDLPSIDSAPPPVAGSGTQTGQLLGTPGYMSPEQVRGDDVGPASDVYALGAILFEILAGEPLHPRGSGALASTLEVIDPSPAHRAPDREIPPELDAACAAALAEEPAARPTARELAERIQDYLDGDRDLERRRSVAAELAQSARRALAAGDRATAMRAAGRALAFDPDARDAAEVAHSLIVDVPDALPPEINLAVAADEAQDTRERSRRAIVPYLSFYAITPAILVLEVESWALLVALYATITATAGLAWVNSRRGPLPPIVWLGLHLLVVTMFSRLVGPFVLTPIVICGTLMSLTAAPWIGDRRWVVVLWTIAAVMTPFALEWLGVWAPSWTMTEHGVSHLGTVFAVGKGQNATALIAANLAGMIVIGLYARRLAQDRRAARRRMHAQAWHFRQLLPAASSKQPPPG